jgi:hypothetical protein
MFEIGTKIACSMWNEWSIDFCFVGFVTFDLKMYDTGVRNMMKPTKLATLHVQNNKFIFFNFHFSMFWQHVRVIFYRMTVDNITKTLKLMWCIWFTYRMESFWVQTAMGALKAAVFVYDVISFPIYFLLQRPWKRRTLAKRIKVGKNKHIHSVLCHHKLYLCYSLLCDKVYV